jgi:hypothetical protein
MNARVMAGAAPPEVPTHQLARSRAGHDNAQAQERYSDGLHHGLNPKAINGNLYGPGLKIQMAAGSWPLARTAKKSLSSSGTNSAVRAPPTVASFASLV